MKEEPVTDKNVEFPFTEYVQAKIGQTLARGAIIWIPAFRIYPNVPSNNQLYDSEETLVGFPFHL